MYVFHYFFRRHAVTPLCALLTCNLAAATDARGMRSRRYYCRPHRPVLPLGLSLQRASPSPPSMALSSPAAPSMTSNDGLDAGAGRRAIPVTPSTTADTGNGRPNTAPATH